jgi:DNA primase
MYETEKLNLFRDILGRCYKSGEEFLFHCKKCGHDKKKLSVNFEKNVFKCWICDYRGNSLFSLVKRYGTYSQKQEWQKYSNVIDVSLSLEELLLGKEEEEEQEQIKISLPEEFISLANKNLPISSIEPMKYLSSRGIKKKEILKWKIGYCNKGEYKNRILIPSFDENGDVNYFVARSYNKKEWPPYKNPNVSKDIVFNELYVDFQNDLVIVEGVFDAVKAENAVPILGSSLREDSKLFQKIVEQNTVVYVALDPDAEKKALTLINKLLLYGVEIYKIDISGYKDVGEMTKEIFLERKKQAVMMTRDEILSHSFLSF